MKTVFFLIDLTQLLPNPNKSWFLFIVVVRIFIQNKTKNHTKSDATNCEIAFKQTAVSAFALGPSLITGPNFNCDRLNAMWN